jgi:hypothetical protein
VHPGVSQDDASVDRSKELWVLVSMDNETEK